FSIDALQAAKKGMQGLIRAVHDDSSGSGNGRVIPQNQALEQRSTRLEKDFAEAMEDDFNTAKAVAFLFGMTDSIGAAKDRGDKEFYVQALKKYANVLGFTLEDTRRILPTETASQLMDLILSLRAESKQRKDYATSDLIRKRLSDCGVNVMDTADGATWETSS